MAPEGVKSPSKLVLLVVNGEESPKPLINFRTPSIEEGRLRTIPLVVQVVLVVVILVVVLVGTEVVVIDLGIVVLVRAVVEQVVEREVIPEGVVLVGRELKLLSSALKES